MKRIPDASSRCDYLRSALWERLLVPGIIYFLGKICGESIYVIKENKSAIVLFGAEPFATQLRMSNLKHYKYDWYWIKNNVTGFTFAKKSADAPQ